MTPAETLRAAAASLRCEHSFPVQPPLGSLARPGACSRCGIPWGDHEPVADGLRESLAALLGHAVKNREAAERGAAFVSDESHTLSPDQIDQLTPYALPVARAILGEVTE